MAKVSGSARRNKAKRRAKAAEAARKAAAAAAADAAREDHDAMVQRVLARFAVAPLAGQPAGPAASSQQPAASANGRAAPGGGEAAPGGGEAAPSGGEAEAAAAAAAALVGDFHMHSTHSDGRLTPAELMAAAAAAGVRFAALTDHDTLAGVGEAQQAGAALGIRVVAGVEISSELPESRESVHVLGYFPSHHGGGMAELEARLAALRRARVARLEGMLSKLAALGVAVDAARVLAIAGEAAPGRLHVAQALVEAGAAADFRDAFGRFLGNKAPAYVPLGDCFPPEEAVRLIRDAGGVSVLAHPWCIKSAERLLPQLAAAGLDGVEVFLNAATEAALRPQAEALGLLLLGGSDFHGSRGADERPLGGAPLPAACIARFLTRLYGQQAAPNG